MSVNVYSDFPDRVEAVIDIIDELGGKQDYLYRNFEHTIEDEVWDIAKEYDNMPNFNNIYYSLAFGELEQLANEKYPELGLEFESDINDLVSSLSFKSQDGYWYEICDKDDFFTKIAELKLEKIDTKLDITSKLVLDNLCDLSLNKESTIALNINGNLLQINNKFEVIDLFDGSYKLLEIYYKDENISLLAKREGDYFDYKIISAGGNKIIDDMALFNTIEPDDIDLSKLDKVMTNANKFLSNLNIESSFLLDTDTMDDFRKEYKSVIYDRFAPLDNDNAKFLKDLIALKTLNFKVKSDDNQQCIFSLEKKNTDEYSLKIISDIKSLARTTYGGEEQNFDFIIYKDKVLALNVTTENGGIKTFSENGIADTEEQVKSTKELLNTLEDLNNKYHIRESIENKVKKFDNKKVKKQN